MNEKIRQTALELLTRRDYAQRELIQKLKAKGHPLHEIELVIHRLAETGLINEKRFTENYIRKQASKGQGPQSILIKLKAYGITDETIAELLKITDNAWFSEIHKVWQKRFKNTLPHDLKSRAKQMRFLQYRGFTREQIDNLFSSLSFSTKDNGEMETT